MTENRIMIAALAIILAAGVSTARLHAAPLLQPQAYGQDRDWQVPPGEFNEVQRRGFHDGLEGARRDFENHRRPDVNNRDEYRNPQIEPGLREAYRAGFRRGYEVGVSHLWGAPPPPPPPPPVAPPPPERPGWETWAMRGLQSDAEHQGYRDGADHARKDFSMQRRPDPDDHQEFRNPPVPPGLADEYREAFMRGYEVTISQLSGEPSWQNGGGNGQWAPPQQFTEMQRRGFHDGIEGAHHDFDNHRRPSVFNRDEYRTPRLPNEFWHDYREGFRRGYEMAASQLWGER
jgi:hypothetical protein